MLMRQCHLECFVTPASKPASMRLLRAGAQVTTLLLDKMRRLKNRLNRIKTRVERVRPGWLKLHWHCLMEAGMLLAKDARPCLSPCFATPS